MATTIAQWKITRKWWWSHTMARDEGHPSTPCTRGEVHQPGRDLHEFPKNDHSFHLHEKNWYVERQTPEQIDRWQTQILKKEDEDISSIEFVQV